MVNPEGTFSTMTLTLPSSTLDSEATCPFSSIKRLSGLRSRWVMPYLPARCSGSSGTLSSIWPVWPDLGPFSNSGRQTSGLWNLIHPYPSPISHPIPQGTSPHPHPPRPQGTQLGHAVDDAMHQASHGAVRHGLALGGDEVEELAVGDGLHDLSGSMEGLDGWRNLWNPVGPT